MMQQRDLTPRCIMQRRDLTLRCGGSNFNCNNSANLKPNLKKNLKYESGSKVGIFDKKNRGGKSRATVPIKKEPCHMPISPNIG
jgi:hypothetical protein